MKNVRKPKEFADEKAIKNNGCRIKERQPLLFELQDLQNHSFFNVNITVSPPPGVVSADTVPP